MGFSTSKSPFFYFLQKFFKNSQTFLLQPLDKPTAASTVDILNPDVVDQFIALTHEQYKKRDTYDLKGFFTDEPQYYRWGTPYTKMLSKYFKENYGEDILDGLGLLFVEKQGYRAFRYKYWKAMQALMLENFAKKIYDWCDENGYKLTGHYVEESSLNAQMWCCGGIMPFYEYEHIPGIDWLGKGIGDAISPRQVSSVAAQLGKRQILTETYGCCGWDVTPQELKSIAEFQYVGGVNLMCQHLLPYSEYGQRKRDYPAHYSVVNPWVRKNFKEFNDYFSYLGKTIAESDEAVNVACFHPIRSVYFNYKRSEEGANRCAVGELEDSFIDVTKELTERQIPFHYLDETLLAKYGKVVGNKLVLGKGEYEFVVFPKIYTMDKTSEKLLREFVNAGGRVLFTDEKPTYLEGEEFDYHYLNTNVSWEEIASAQPYTASRSECVRTTYRVDPQGNKFIFAVNLGDDTEMEFSVKGATSFVSYDILKDERTVLSTKVHFDKGQSYLLYLNNETPAETKAKKPVYLGKEFTVCGNPKNYLFIDFLRYSFDGENYSEPLHHMGIFDEMLKKRYKGKLYLKYDVTVDEIPQDCILLAEDTNVVWVEVNGQKTQRCGVSEYERALLKFDVADKLQKGKNEIVVLMDYFQSEQVYYALFGENVTESLKNCLAYDSTIEGIALKGCFGVYGDFTQYNAKKIVLGENFRIGKQTKTVTDLVEQGYPFFAGDITLNQKLYTEDTDCELVIDDRFQMLEIKVNGVELGKWMFGKRLDISKALRVGENDLEITLTVGNRNLLGAFHTLDPENFWTGPYTWERMGTWKDGKSPAVVDQYSFVKTLV